MGFFSKLWKGLKNTVKKIGKGIKSAFAKFGKFMGKIGILGQVAMFFIMPYVGAALGGAFTGVAGALATNTVGGVLGAVGQVAGKVMQFVGNTVSKVGTVFNNITKGVTDTLGNFAKTASNKMFGTTFDAAANFFGPGDSAFGRSFGGESRFANLTSDNVFFEDIKKSRQVQLDRKTMNALDQTVAESASDWDSFEYGQKEFVSNPAYDQAIADGTTNITASADVDAYMRDPSQMRLDITDIDNTSLLREQGVSQSVIDNLGVTEFPVVERAPSFEYGQVGSTGVLDGINVAPELSVSAAQLPSLDYNVAVPPPSLMERLKTGVKGMPDAAYKKAGEIADDPFGYAGKGMEERFQSGVQTRLMQEAGIVEKPEYNVQNISNVAYVPSFDSFGGSQQQYGAPEIMSPRAFEQQVTNNASPYGYTAFQYNQYMAQFGQTA